LIASRALVRAPLDRLLVRSSLSSRSKSFAPNMPLRRHDSCESTESSPPSQAEPLPGAAASESGKGGGSGWREASTSAVEGGKVVARWCEAARGGEDAVASAGKGQLQGRGGAVPVRSEGLHGTLADARANAEHAVLRGLLRACGARNHQRSPCAANKNQLTSSSSTVNVASGPTRQLSAANDHVLGSPGWLDSLSLAWRQSSRASATRRSLKTCEPGLTRQYDIGDHAPSPLLALLPPTKSCLCCK
jgi:hypothetical protein